MAFRGRGGGRGMGRGRGRGRGTGAHNPSRLARSGIRTRGGGYKKFDSQRVREIQRESADPESQSTTHGSTSASDVDDEELEQDDNDTAGSAYAALLHSFVKAEASDTRPVKRRRVETVFTSKSSSDNEMSDEESDAGSSGKLRSETNGSQVGSDIEDDEDDDDDSQSDRISVQSGDLSDTSGVPLSATAPYEAHFTKTIGTDLTVDADRFPFDAGHEQYRSKAAATSFVGTIAPNTAAIITAITRSTGTEDLPVKPRLKETASKQKDLGDALLATTAPYVLSYTDLLITNRTPRNASSFRKLLAMHSINHVLTGRDRVLKNNARLAQADDDEMLELRDQGFTRPKVLILTETRQMCASYAQCIVDWFKPDQQENRQRFQDSFSTHVEESSMPEDYQELFQGNNDNNFLTTIKFTRKTSKFFSAFYQSDIILASPLGLRRIIEHEDKKKRDYDFLSSIELMIIDQADAMQMQSWENVELVLKHLNLQPKELRDCDVNRVRHWYLDGQAKHLRQTVVSSAYLTPEINRLFNSELQNIAGKVKASESYRGAIQAVTGLGIKQIFSRFPSRSPLEDPDARFKFFTSSALPSLLRIPQPAEGGQGILVFIPSYFDLLRIRNFFATSTMTENVSFGAIHDYSEVSEQSRARSHFMSGKHSILLYTQRAHHFFRLRLKGVKRIVMYGLPDNPIFYEEIVAGYLGSSKATGTGAGECSVRSIFSKFDALKMERIVGSDRVRSMLAGTGDTFEFV